MWFTSDNAAGCPPQVLAALSRANESRTPNYGKAGETALNRTPDYASGYGTDPWTAAVQTRLRQIFEAPEAVVHLVSTGTAANALALATICPPWASVFCHSEAHILVDECGAPEFFSHGARMVGVAGDHGRIAPAALRDSLAAAGQSLHNLQRGAVSLTNVTEAGSVYTPAQTAELAEIAREFCLPVHLDGARFCNAVAATGASPAALSWQAGVDVLSFGGTKNGLMGVEAVVFFNPAYAATFELRRKRGGHLLSKGRFLAAQMLAMLEGNLWQDWAAHANLMAARLAQGLASKGVVLTHPVEANILFVQWPAGVSAQLRAQGAMFYDMPAPAGQEGARLVTSWSSKSDDIDTFVSLFKDLH